MNNNGKVISVFGYYLHGAGVSTVAMGLATMLQKKVDKKVLLINLDSNKSFLEKYIENDAEMKHSLDDIAIYKSELTTEVIINHANVINERLSVISKSENGKLDCEFVEKLINEAKKGFEIVVIDTGNLERSYAKKILHDADHIVYVSKFNKLVWESIEDDKELMGYIKSKKTEIVFNQFPLEYSKEMTVKSFRKNMNVDNNIYPIFYSNELYTKANEKKMLYSYLLKKADKSNDFIHSMDEMCTNVINTLGVEDNKHNEKGGAKSGWKIKIF